MATAAIVPDYLRGHQTWAVQFKQQYGRWPYPDELARATEGWWTRDKLPDWITPRDVEAAEAYKRATGRYPGLAELPQALAMTARSGEPYLGETPDIAATAAVTREISPLLQGAGRDVFGQLANRSFYMDYSRQAMGGKAPTMGYADFLRSQLPQTLYGGPEGTPGMGTGRQITPGVSWGDVTQGGAPGFYSDEEAGRRAVIGAYLRNFAPYARGTFFNSLLGRLQEAETAYPGLAQGGTQQSFADYLKQALSGYTGQ